jgi:hypothetical protein
MKRTLTISALALAGVLILWACASDSPKQVAEKFLNALAHGDVDGARKYASEDSKLALTMIEDKLKDNKKEPSKIEMGSETITDETAVVTYKENDYEKSVKLKKESGKWKVIFSKEDFGEGPKEVGDKFLQAYAKGDLETCKEYATKDSHAALDMLKGQMDAKKSKPSKIEIGEIDDNTISATLKYKEDGVDKELNLSKEDEKWKVSWAKSGIGNDTPMEDTNNAEGDTIFD